MKNASLNDLPVRFRVLPALFFLFFIAAAPAQGDERDHITASPKAPWAEIREEPENQDEGWVKPALLWLPNRLLDFIDIFKLDVGAGPMGGAVIRASNQIQVGIRSQMPAALRVGLMGRQSPVMIENSGEIGVSPAFQESKQRIICPGEFGAGLDLVALGIYGGICIDELFDFIGGIFLVDLKEDDLRWE